MIMQPKVTSVLRLNLLAAIFTISFFLLPLNVEKARVLSACSQILYEVGLPKLAEPFAKRALDAIAFDPHVAMKDKVDRVKDLADIFAAENEHEQSADALQLVALYNAKHDGRKISRD